MKTALTRMAAMLVTMAVVCFVSQGTSIRAAEILPAQKVLPVPGETFMVDGHPAFLSAASLTPAVQNKPWVWYAPTLPGLPGPEERWMFTRFLDSGIAIAGIDAGESYGSPNGNNLFTKFYGEMTKRGYSAKPVLLGRSRGGLMTLSWAEQNPEKVGAFAGIYPVSNLASYPGISKAAPAYEMTAAQLEAQLRNFNPLDRLDSLAKMHLPLFAIHGDSDKLVPLSDNSQKLYDRYKALNGSMELIIPPGQGHNMWSGFFQCSELVDFVRAHAGPNITIHSPLDYQVIQRYSSRKGVLKISGAVAGVPEKRIVIEARLIVDGHPSKWRRLHLNSKTHIFDGQWTAPSGGWHRLEVRGRSRSNILAESSVQHVGIGEVFVVAGQSNAANHGEEKQTTQTHLVSVMDGEKWRLANDPQPGASGSGGSFMPSFGDAISARFHVPVGFVACAVGATSVREWLPAGAIFPNPPTLTNNVTSLGNGKWASNGNIYDNFTRRMDQLGPHGFRAVLWHQGESDAHQADSSRTLSGALYREYLHDLIIDSRHAIGWEAPWFVARATYHIPGDEGSPEIRAAQAALWKDHIAMEGPDTDQLKGNLRENHGQGVHFTGEGLREHGRLWSEKVGPWLEKQLGSR